MKEHRKLGMCLIIISERCQNGMKYGYLMTEDLPYKPLYFRPGSLRLAPGLKYNDLIGAISAFNCLYLAHYFSERAEICNE